MPKTQIVWNMAGFRALRTDPGVMAELDAHAERIAATASASVPGGFEAEPAQVTGGRVRGRAAVITASVEGMVAEATNHVLLRALGGQGLVLYTSKAGRTSLVTAKQAANYQRSKRTGHA